MKNIKVAKIAELRSNKCMMTLKAIILVKELRRNRLAVYGGLGASNPKNQLEDHLGDQACLKSTT